VSARAIVGRIGFYVVLSIVGALFALPLLWLVMAPWTRLVSLTLRLPDPHLLTLANFQAVFHDSLTASGLVNSVILAGGTMILSTLCATLGSYALSRSRIPHAQLLTYGLILFSSVESGGAAILPLFLLVSGMHLINTYEGVILASTGGAIPGAIFLMRAYVDGLPRSYEEASMVCGAGTLRTLWTVVVPMLRPGMVVISVITFVGVWGSFVTPYILLRSSDMYPASVAIFSLYTEYGSPDLPLTSAYALLYAAPVVALYLVANWRYGFRFFGGLRG
jgi:multiple sugar transport system permease protein